MRSLLPSLAPLRDPGRPVAMPGIHQRAALAAGGLPAAAGREPEPVASCLARELLHCWSQGLLSGTAVQRLAHAGVLDGISCSNLADLACLGGVGAWARNVPRDLRALLDREVQIAEPVLVQVPALDSKLEVPETVADCPVLLPHLLLWSLARNYENWSELLGISKLSELWPQCHVRVAVRVALLLVACGCACRVLPFSLLRAIRPSCSPHGLAAWFRFGAAGVRIPIDAAVAGGWISRTQVLGWLASCRPTAGRESVGRAQPRRTGRVPSVAAVSIATMISRNIVIVWRSKGRRGEGRQNCRLRGVVCGTLQSPPWAAGRDGGVSVSRREGRGLGGSGAVGFAVEVGSLHVRRWKLPAGGSTGTPYSSPPTA